MKINEVKVLIKIFLVVAISAIALVLVDLSKESIWSFSINQLVVASFLTVTLVVLNKGKSNFLMGLCLANLIILLSVLGVLIYFPAQMFLHMFSWCLGLYLLFLNPENKKFGLEIFLILVCFSVVFFAEKLLSEYFLDWEILEYSIPLLFLLIIFLDFKNKIEIEQKEEKLVLIN